MTNYMPLMGTRLAIAFDVLNEEWAQRNHSQNLRTLADRGGLAPDEALAIMQRRRYKRDADAIIKVLASLPIDREMQVNARKEERP